MAEVVRVGKSWNLFECLMVERERWNGGMEETEPDEEMWENAAQQTEKMQGKRQCTCFPVACLSSVCHSGGQT